MERLHVSDIRRRAKTVLPGRNISIVPPTHILGTQLIWLRPGIRQVLTQLSGSHNLAIWSTNTRKNTLSQVNHLFPEINFKFVFHREHTISDSMRRKDAKVFFPDDLKHKWHHATLRNYPGAIKNEYFDLYNPNATTFVETSIDENRGFCENCIVIEPYDFDPIRTVPSETSDQNLNLDLDRLEISPESDVSDSTLSKLITFLENDLAKSKDVRCILPRKLV